MRNNRDSIANTPSPQAEALRAAINGRLAIIFDVEGTLVDCVPQTIECWQQTLAARGFHFPTEVLQHYSGMDGKLMLSSLLPSQPPALREALLEEQGKRYRENFLPGIKPFRGARSLFETLAARGHRLGLATTCQPDELRFYLRLLDISDFVTAAVCGNDVKRGKPAPDLILLAAERLAAFEMDGLAMVGDTPYDAQAALAAGARPVGLLTGGFSATELERAGCVAVATDLCNLRRSVFGLDSKRVQPLQA
jgi:HAD superfamily hydrolase (TIGR01549 family)